MIISQHPTHHLNLCLHDPSLYCPDLVTWLRDGGRRRGRLLPRAQSNHSRFQCGKFQVKFLTQQQQLLKGCWKTPERRKLTQFFNHFSITPPTDHIWFDFEFFSNYFRIYFYYYYFFFQILEPQSLSLYLRSALSVLSPCFKIWLPYCIFGM
jgi:hypothetical protein